MILLAWYVYCFLSGMAVGELADHFEVSNWLAIPPLILFNLLIYGFVIAPLEK